MINHRGHREHRGLYNTNSQLLFFSVTSVLSVVKKFFQS